MERDGTADDLKRQIPELNAEHEWRYATFGLLLIFAGSIAFEVVYGGHAYAVVEAKPKGGHETVDETFPWRRHLKPAITFVVSGLIFPSVMERLLEGLLGKLQRTRILFIGAILLLLYIYLICDDDDENADGIVDWAEDPANRAICSTAMHARKQLEFSGTFICGFLTFNGISNRGRTMIGFVLIFFAILSGLKENTYRRPSTGGASMRRVEQEPETRSESESELPPAPSPSASSAPSSPIPIGTRVELHGLKMKKLNRQRGVVAGFDAGSGRCVVKLEDGREFKSKVENLKRIATSNSKKKKGGGCTGASGE